MEYLYPAKQGCTSLNSLLTPTKRGYLDIDKTINHAYFYSSITNTVKENSRRSRPTPDEKMHCKKFGSR